MRANHTTPKSPAHHRRYGTRSTVTRCSAASTSTTLPAGFFAKWIGRQHVLGTGPAHQKGCVRFCAAPADQGGRAVAPGRHYCGRLGPPLSWGRAISQRLVRRNRFPLDPRYRLLLARLEEPWHGSQDKDRIASPCRSSCFLPPSTSRTCSRRRSPAHKLSPRFNRINDRYGRWTIGLGLFQPDVRAFKGHAGFHRVSER